MRRCAELITRFGRDESGVFAVVFGVMAIVLIAFGGAAVDYVSMEQVRNRSQIALDAAALALQPDIFDSNISDESIRKRAEDLMIERIGDDRVTATLDPVRIDRLGGSLQLSARIVTPTLFVSLVGVNSLSASITAEAVRGSLDLEISVALDVTGSMSGTKIRDLRTSVAELIEAVVQEEQKPNSSRMALVPYSQAFNAGKYAAALRGPIRGPKPIKTIAWSTGATKPITGATKANEVTITAKGHGFLNDEWVYIWSVSGMTQLNGNAYQVKDKTNDTFKLRGVDGRNYNSYSKNGSVVKCLEAECSLRVTANNHGYNTGEYVHVTDVQGLTAVNNLSFMATKVDNNSLTLKGAFSGNLANYVANTGLLHCTWESANEGCTYFRFTGPNGNSNTFAITDCITERAFNGANDLPPSATFAGRNYPPSGNPCLGNKIVPLTSNKADLFKAASGLKEEGSTAGSLGILGAWYMLSPNFGYVWDVENRPEPYERQELLKAAIIMTDGEFNTVHCKGAIARNSTSGSGSTNDHINCTAPNGAPYVQARAYCDAMKAENIGIVIYTVAFDIAANSEASKVMTYCASDVDKAFKASDGAALRESFRQIARNLSVLRLAR